MEKYIINTDKYYIYTKTGKKIPVRDLQNEVVSIMDVIDKICRKNDIRYCLMAGSALGAISNIIFSTYFINNIHNTYYFIL